MLDVTNLDFDYSEQSVLNGVEFHLNRGSLLHLRGANGAGKTTLLKLLAGLLRPTQGQISYHGQSIWDNLPVFQQSICYVGHKNGMSQLLTVREYCQYEFAQMHKFDEVINRFNLQGLEDVVCALLSVGQRRRVGLLRILMSNAPLWLLDEPLVGLDHQSITILVSCFAEHLDTGGQIILTSHQDIPLNDRAHQEYVLGIAK